MTLWLLVLVLAVTLRPRRARPMRVKYGARDNPVVAGRAMFKCGCVLSMEGVHPCAAHEALGAVDI